MHAVKMLAISSVLFLCLWVAPAKFGLTSDAVEVFHQGEAGFTCIRAPATIQVQDGVLLTFAAGRCYQGDNCYPQKDVLAAQDKKDYGAHIMKRSVDGGRTWSAVVEISKGKSSKDCSLRSSLEGAPFFDARTNTTVAMWSSDVVGNTTTGLTLWQSESKDAGVTWSTPHPVRIPTITAADVHSGTHIPPGSGIQLHHPGGQHYGRLLVVLILQSHCKEDVVIYSDDAGQTWEMSKTRLVNNGEAQVAELGADEVIFDGRSNTARGVAMSTDGGQTFSQPKFVDDPTSGVSCLASLLALPPPKPQTQPQLQEHLSAVGHTPVVNCSSSSYFPHRSAKKIGAAITDFLTDSAQACCAACNNNSRCFAWTLAGAHQTEPKKKTTCYLLGPLTGPMKNCSWCISGLTHKPAPPPSPAGQVAPLLFSHPSEKDRSKGVVLRSTDGAGSWTRVAYATPNDEGKKFGYSSLTLLVNTPAATATNTGSFDCADTVTNCSTTTMVGLTYETSGPTCTSATSACLIMYRNVSL